MAFVMCLLLLAKGLLKFLMTVVLKEKVTFFSFKQFSFNQLLIILKEEISGADNPQISFWNALDDGFLQ